MANHRFWPTPVRHRVTSSSRFWSSVKFGLNAAIPANRSTPDQPLSVNPRCLCFHRGGFNRIGRRSVSCHLQDVNAVENRRTLFPVLSGDASRLPPHLAFLQNLESVCARVFEFGRFR